MGRGFCYLVAVVQCFRRKVFSWRLSITMDAASCIEALEEALAKYGNPEIFNSDQGTYLHAYTSVPGARTAIARYLIFYNPVS
ncbi:hypothetical protein MesoLjLa_66470 (plasmid) [Mesorhizobium sp. L-2-11]|nr:hypothetical protein MesoLjLa_66470 [Mesorhizobium sp. L-2-11]